ncbi:uncharacterized protein EDB93DRAFT_1331178 [Suillus bovinus]|uniref:uncharacterized protein n=1 Tax=Suillus bovinus TaxID=48563 RepID=UPI001B87B3C8|nr:uncharacterized protein EDB93DRAFT_1331178 [Suillus bovinus]KAG2134884.1 hypothetical protein EDB93DRAFT_1331178 [Suillus bovinus]
MSELIPITTPLREFKGHEGCIEAVAVFPDNRWMVTGSEDKMLRLWNLETGLVLKNMEGHLGCVRSLAVSRNGQLIASGDTYEVIIWHGETGELFTRLKTHSNCIMSLDFSRDGTVLATGSYDLTTILWNTKTWEQQGDSINCHIFVNCVRYSPSGEQLAIATCNDIQIYNLDTRKRVASFKAHTEWNCSLVWTPDGTCLLTGGNSVDPSIREWDTTTWKQTGNPWTGHTDQINDIAIHPTGTLVASASDDSYVRLWWLSDGQNVATFKHRFNMKCVTFSVNGKHLLSGGYDSMISEWASISIQPSLTGYISKGIALCGNGHVLDARAALDVASMYTNQDPEILFFLLLIKAVALFNADQYDEANLLLKELASCPNADTLACCVVQAYLRVQLGIKALDGARHDEAVDHLTAALDCRDSLSKSNIHEIYEDLVVFFGWDLKCLWQKANQKRCDALLRAGKLQDALKSYQHVMASSDETTNADCFDWSNDFKQECSAFCAVNGDAAFAANDYDKAIDLYSTAIDLNSTSDVAFANRSKAKLGKMLWEDALLDAQKVTELNPSSHIGYQLAHTALRGAQRYDEAIEAFTIMLSKLDDAPEAQIRDLRQQYVCPSEAEDAIRRVVWIELNNAPLRLLNTSTGLFPEYKELLSFTTNCSDLQMERIKEVVAMHFRCVLLSHRWEEMEVLLHDIQDKAVYELNGLSGIAKLQSFCKIARDAGYFWAWMDTCCIDKTNNVELQESVNSMFVWYRHSALTIVYLSDIPPSSPPGALARSVWIERGWTFQEFVAPKVRFYQKDWSLYLEDRSPNHKESPAIMKELEGATGIDAQALISFRPGMKDAREKLKWASKRVTTMQEDIAYSLFGIFGVYLPVIYGEKKQNALGRLLQEIVARSGDITSLDWVGESSEFNSCLPADIISYATPPCSLLSLSEDGIQTAVSSLRNIVTVDLASKLYNLLENMNVPLFGNCRLRLPCIAFRVTEVRRRRGDTVHSMYGVKADGLRDLLITTDEILIQFSRARPTQQTFFLVRPWDRRLLGLPDFAEQLTFVDEGESVGNWSESESALDDTDESSSDSPGEEGLSVDSDAYSRSLRLMVHLGQPFSALLVAQQRVGEYKRVASDHDIIAQVKDTASIDIMNIRTLDIL